MSKPPLTSLSRRAARGFCAGVDRAIKIVEMALEKWGAPVYVRHEIVHNQVRRRRAARERGGVRRGTRGLPRGPAGDLLRPRRAEGGAGGGGTPAHGLRRRDCPLVSKVHIEAERHHANGLQMVMIGHEGHPETVGTMGQLPDGEVLLVETVEDVAGLDPRDPSKLAFITQTTLSVDDTADIVAALQARFPASSARTRKTSAMARPTVRRAVKAMAPKIDAPLP